MTIVKSIILGAMAVSLIWLVYRLFSGKNAGKTLLASASMGLTSLLIICILGQMTTELLHLNLYTVGTASVLGIPGVVLMILIKMLWVL